MYGSFMYGSCTGHSCASHWYLTWEFVVASADRCRFGSAQLCFSWKLYVSRIIGTTSIDCASTFEAFNGFKLCSGRVIWCWVKDARVLRQEISWRKLPNTFSEHVFCLRECINFKRISYMIHNVDSKKIVDWQSLRDHPWRAYSEVLRVGRWPCCIHQLHVLCISAFWWWAHIAEQWYAPCPQALSRLRLGANCNLHELLYSSDRGGYFDVQMGNAFESACTCEAHVKAMWCWNCIVHVTANWSWCACATAPAAAES